MKPVVSMLLLCGALIVSSCIPSEEAINPLAGSWTLKGISCQNCIDTSQITSTTYSCNESGCNIYTFNADGSLTISEAMSGSAKTVNGHYSISGSTVTLRLNDGGSIVNTYLFSFVGSMLYLKEIVDESTGKCSSTTVLAK
jgi:hypothetical protein